MDHGICERCGERCGLAYDWADLVCGKYYPVKNKGKELTAKEQADFHCIVTFCSLASIWLIIGVTWAAISQLSFPLVVCVWMMWVFWVWGILSVFMFTPYVLLRAYRLGVFEE